MTPHIIVGRVSNVYNETSPVEPPTRNWLARHAHVSFDIVEVIKGNRSPQSAWQDAEGTTCSMGDLSLAPGDVRIFYYRDNGELMYQWSSALWQSKSMLEELRKLRDK